MELFKKLPSTEDYVKQLNVKKNLTSELCRYIRILQGNVEKTVITDNDECVSALCNVLEAIFIHGLKDKLSAKVSSVFGSSSEKIPEPQFWIFVSKYCHNNVISEIKNLNQITTDIGRCRAWLRIALNEGLIVSYISTMLVDKSLLQKFYHTAAYLRDDEQSDIMKHLLEGINIFHFELSCNNSTLNCWNSLPLTLANLWTPPATPQPVMPAVDVIDFFTDERNKPKLSKGDSSCVQNKGDLKSSQNDLSSTNEKSDATISDEKSQNIISEQNISQKNNYSNSVAKAIFREIEDSASNNSLCPETTEIQENALYDNDETSSKLSSSDSVPDFGNECIITSSPEILIGSSGNRLNEKSGWSSAFNDGQIETENGSGQSYDSLLQSYNKNLSKVVVGTPELADTFSSIMGIPEDECSGDSLETKSPDLDFEIIPKYFTAEGADLETKRMLNIVGKICSEQGLDAQNYHCYSCGRPLGLLFGKARVCYFDGFSYCNECHDNDEFFIPARIVHNWDFNKYPVAKRSKSFLCQIIKDPMLDIKSLNPDIYNAVEEMAQLQLLRTQLTFLRSYIFTCKASVVEELRTRLWPREYLFEHVHLYAVDDLLEIPSGTLSQTLQKVIVFAKNHVSSCQLCLLKGFICEVCNNPKPIYPFDVESTYHCEKCLAVYHANCMDKNKYCPKCIRRLKRQQMLESASVD